MKTRTILSVSIALFVLGSTAFAAGPRQGKMGADCPRAGIGCAQQLDLTDAQRQQIFEIAKKFRTDSREIWKSDATKEQKQANIKALKSDAAAAINALLTPGQREKADKIGFTNKILGRRAGMKARMGLALGKLNLSQVQKTEIRGIFEQSRESAKAIRANTALDDAAKKAPLTELRKDTHEKVLAMLTPEQRQQLEQMTKPKRGPRK